MTMAVCKKLCASCFKDFLNGLAYIFPLTFSLTEQQLLSIHRRSFDSVKLLPSLRIRSYGGEGVPGTTTTCTVTVGGDSRGHNNMYSEVRGREFQGPQQHVQ